MKWGRFLTFLLLIAVIFGLTLGTGGRLAKNIPLGLDLKGGFDLLYKVQPTADSPLTTQGIQAALQAVEMRVNSLGVSSPSIQLENKDEIRVDVATTMNQQKAEDIIGKTAELKIYGQAKQGKNGKWTPIGKPLVTGKDVKSNAQWTQGQYGNNVVAITFKNKSQWQKITTKYLGKQIYTFLNNNMIMNATVKDVISDGNTSLSGPANEFTPAYCQTLAKELNAGALPYPLKLISSMNVGPSLGAASLKATLWAGVAAIALIFLFMLILYRMAGLIACIALVAYGYLTMFTFAGMHVVLTLSGLAALVLGIGMAVDANIITYERIKEEVRNGRSLQSAVIAGNKRALRSIIDANATTFIAGVVMYWFGQGDIRGFAVALMISIIISMLTAVLLSRLMLVMFTKSNVVKRPWWFGLRKGGVKS